MSSKSLNRSFISLFHRLRRSLLTAKSSHWPTKQPPLEYDHQEDDDRSHLVSSKTETTAVVDVEGWLLRSPSTFPYFMLVALEAGGLLRGLLLLLFYPLLCCIGQEMSIRVMTMVSFFGIKAENFKVGTAVLPKFFLEDVGEEQAMEVVRRGGRNVVCVTRLPEVMVTCFLQHYLGVEVVVGRKVKVVGGYYTGLLKMTAEMDVDGVVLGRDGECVGFACSGQAPKHPIFGHCKELHLATKVQKIRQRAMSRDQYIQKMIFHDGRLAFRPTPAATTAFFLYLPLGFVLATCRAIICLILPYSLSIPLSALTGMRSRVVVTSTVASSDKNSDFNSPTAGRLYVCNHRTLLDPVYVSGALGKAVSTVTYSISSISEKLSPIKTVALTRDREEDRRRMTNQLASSDLVVCPEGTTCREPYLLRFSPLFAEIAEAVVPVAIAVRVGMFYGTSTAAGKKFLDPFYFLMNPNPAYWVEFLEAVKTKTGSSRGTTAAERRQGSIEVANRVQNEIGKALGFELTSLTRKEKYLMLAGNEGFIAA